MTPTSYPTRPRSVNPTTDAPLRAARRRASRASQPSRASLRTLVEDRMEQTRYELTERWKAIQTGTETTTQSHWVIAALNEIAYRGVLDSLDGRGYLYEGFVGDGAKRERCWAQIKEYQGEICITFWPQDGRARRLLVTEGGTAYVEIWTTRGPSAIRHTGKYLKAWHKLAQIRVTRCLETHQETGVARGR